MSFIHAYNLNMQHQWRKQSRQTCIYKHRHTQTYSSTHAHTQAMHTHSHQRIHTHTITYATYNLHSSVQGTDVYTFLGNSTHATKEWKCAVHNK